MATKPKKGFKTKSQEKREVTNSQAAKRENERIRAIAARPMLSDPRSDICNTGYWACKPK